MYDRRRMHKSYHYHPTLYAGEVVEKYLWADLTTLLAVYDADDNLVQRFEYTQKGTGDNDNTLK